MMPTIYRRNSGEQEYKPIPRVLQGFLEMQQENCGGNVSMEAVFDKNFGRLQAKAYKDNMKRKGRSYPVLQTNCEVFWQY